MSGIKYFSVPSRKLIKDAQKYLMASLFLEIFVQLCGTEIQKLGPKFNLFSF